MILLRQSPGRNEAPTEVEVMGPGPVCPYLKTSLGTLIVIVPDSWLSSFELDPSTIEDPSCRGIYGRGSRVIKVSDPSWSCHEFEPSATKDPPCRAAMHVKSVESSNVLPLVWCGS
ncbi:hypothetical protein TNCV_2493021 [Trichonephila clavipes]|uniref:Uncharacterized protein n=1 Tax=Trichonephila clavipes TaxID=2585209 RepID=A0A8X6UZT3_TRICX|nr:hypothetical protein TNCV_2493021 [Trichonephila clavipes]